MRSENKLKGGFMPTGKLNLDGKVLAEQVHGAMTMQDVSDTSNELWKLKDEIGNLLKDLTVDELRELAVIVRQWYNS